MDKLLERMERASFVHFVAVGLVVLYWCIRVTAFTSLGGDEAEQVLFAQSFRWGYDVSNPPLYTWILIGLFALFGKSVGLVLALKYFVLALMYVAMYHAARITLGSERKLDASLAALSLLLFFLVGWHAIFSYSHALINALLIILTYIAVVQVFKDARLRWYLALGVLVGLGLLTKYSYLLFFLALLGAGLSIADLRGRVISVRMLLALGIAGVLLFPHVAWLAGSAEQLQHAVNHKLQVDDKMPWVEGVIRGLLSIARAMFAFMSPYWLIVAALFPFVFRKRKGVDEASWMEKLLARAFVIVLTLMVLMVVVGGTTQFRPNYLFMMLLFPLWVFLRIPVEVHPGWRRKIYAASVMAAAVLSVGGLAVKAAADPLTCGKCQLLIPYDDIARELKARGFTGGTLFASWYPSPLSDNLALYMEDTRVVSRKFPNIRPPANPVPGQCLIVWWPEEQSGEPTRDMVGLSGYVFKAKADINMQATRLRFPLYRAPGKEMLVDYILFESGLGDCR